LEDEFPLKLGYFQGPTVNLPEGIPGVIHESLAPQVVGLPGGIHSSLMPELRAAATAKVLEGKGWEKTMDPVETEI
jgi:hypothetical protein